jgi:hypothetical protein
VVRNLLQNFERQKRKLGGSTVLGRACHLTQIQGRGQVQDVRYWSMLLEGKTDAWND